MKIIITAYPTEQILVKIVDEFNNQFSFEPLKVWYKDLYGTVAKLRAEYPEVKEIVLAGPESYIVHIGETLHSMFEDNPINITIMATVWEIETDDTVFE